MKKFPFIIILSSGVGFPACITAHMTRGSASRGRGLHRGGWGFCIRGSCSGGAGLCIWVGGGFCILEESASKGGGRNLQPGGLHLGVGVYIRRGGLPTGGFGRPRPPLRYMGYYEIRSTSEQYASYWNAFLFMVIVRVENIHRVIQMDNARHIWQAW